MNSLLHLKKTTTFCAVSILMFLSLSCDFGKSKTVSNTSNIATIIGLKSTKAMDFEIVDVKDFSIPQGTRIEVRITVRPEMNLESLEHTIKKAIHNSYYKYGRPNAISVLVYKRGQSTRGVYTVAKADFAPQGDWGNTNYGDLNYYEVKMDINDSYFATDEIIAPILIPNGSKVKVFNSTKYVLINGRRKEIKTSTVDIFSSPGNLTEENKVGEIPNNSVVTILNVYYRDLPQGLTWTTYKVKYKNKVGWVFDFNLKSI